MKLVAAAALAVSVVGLATQSASGFAFVHGKSGRKLTALAASTHKIETLTVTPIKSLDGVVTLPGSKSLSNRCLLLAALSEGSTVVENLLESDDIRYMLEALDQMKVPVERVNKDTVVVTGQAGPINSPNPEVVSELFLGNAGTAMRPLAAALCMGKGKFVLDGVPRMRERPIADLIDGLKQLGADVTCVEETGCPPVTINANGLKGGKVSEGWPCKTQNSFPLTLHSGLNQREDVITIPFFTLDGCACHGWRRHNYY
jgi:3-phosphoshikimate 1-carboxyvinyltransferase